MLNDFLNSIKGELTNQIAGKTDLNPENAKNASGVVAETFKNGLAEKAKQGKFDDILSLFGEGKTSTGFAGNLINNTVGNLAAKVGLPKEVAAKVAGFAVPFIISKLGSFASEKGKNNKEGVQDLFGDLIKGSVKDKLLGGLGKKFGF
ncbi:MAG: hypothetical protein K0B11_03035 [Mariniphaga sp.]|nr:hypothetical protein [Mariniphaga sp.]